MRKFLDRLFGVGGKQRQRAARRRNLLAGCEQYEARCVLDASPWCNVPLPGDVNSDGVVSSLDAQAVQATIANGNVQVVQGTSPSNGGLPDVTNDWWVNQADVDSVNAAIGQGSGSGSGSSSGSGSGGGSASGSGSGGGSGSANGSSSVGVIVPNVCVTRDGTFDISEVKPLDANGSPIPSQFYRSSFIVHRSVDTGALDVTFHAPNGDPGTVLFNPSGTASADISLTNVSLTNMTVHFNPGQTQVVIYITVLNDFKPEPPEAFEFTLIEQPGVYTVEPSLRSQSVVVSDNDRWQFASTYAADNVLAKDHEVPTGYVYDKWTVQAYWTWQTGSTLATVDGSLYANYEDYQFGYGTTERYIYRYAQLRLALDQATGIITIAGGNFMQSGSDTVKGNMSADAGGTVIVPAVPTNANHYTVAGALLYKAATDGTVTGSFTATGGVTVGDVKSNGFGTSFQVQGGLSYSQSIGDKTTIGDKPFSFDVITVEDVYAY